MLAEEFAAVKARLSEPLPSKVANDLRRILYGTYAILKVHFAKEEDMYLSFLDEQTFSHRPTRHGGSA